MISIALSEKGKKVYARAIGYADLSRQQRADTLTQYHIGSITKMFTATMIFQLIEEGKLGLDTRLDHFFPSLPNSKQITIGLLLNHRSGLYNFTDDSLYERYQQLTKTKQQMLDLFASQTPEFEPDTKSSYSNTNYVLLGYILEVLTGKSYAENLQQRICTKIGLMHTVVAQSGRRSATEADSYTWAQQWKRAIETDMSIPGGAGAIIATPSDLCLRMKLCADKKRMRRKFHNFDQA